MEKSKKSLGQNFLLNKEKIKEIVGALDIKSGDTVIEIGPGHGELTKEIKNQISNIKIIAIEKDERLAEELKNEMGIYGDRIEIIAGDALEVITKLKIKNYKIMGNIPYYITGFLLRTISGLKNKPSVTVLTVQKEVAERICGGIYPVRNLARAARAPEGSARRVISNGMNLLAASVRYWAEPEIIGIIPKSDFSPQPKVDSAIIRLKTIDRKQEIGSEVKDSENYYKFIKILFKQPRKTILNNLFKTGKNKKEIEKVLKENGVNPNDRAQNLEVADIKKISNIIGNS